jgi:hypothetical protein
LTLVSRAAPPTMGPAIRLQRRSQKSPKIFFFHWENSSLYDIQPNYCPVKSFLKTFFVVAMDTHKMKNRLIFFSVFLAISLSESSSICSRKT